MKTLKRSTTLKLTKDIVEENFLEMFGGDPTTNLNARTVSTFVFESFQASGQHREDLHEKYFQKILQGRKLRRVNARQYRQTKGQL